MRTRAGFAAVLGLLIAAVPTVVSLCELRCVATEVGPSPVVSPACAGHGAQKETEPSPGAPSGGHHECSGHVLLARGGSGGIALRLDRAIGAAIPDSATLVLTFAERRERGQLGSADLSPPLARTSDILRL